MPESWKISRIAAGSAVAVLVAAAILNLPRDPAPAVDELPRLVIDIESEPMRTLSAQRQAVLDAGVFWPGARAYVQASIRNDAEPVPVKLRLKRGPIEHIAGNKWPLQIKTDPKTQILGMRIFSIQHPETRGFQGQSLFFATMKRMGVLTPRYFFVNVTVNGSDIGIMAIEEDFSKQLLESHERKEGVIVRFDDADYRSSLASGADTIDFRNFRDLQIKASSLNAIRKSKRLSMEFQVGEALLHGFSNGQLPASDVFDAEALGSFLAVLELYASWHDVQLNDYRLYLDSWSMKFENIAYGADMQNRGESRQFIADTDDLARAMLVDPKIEAAYVRKLKSLVAEVIDGSLIEKLEFVERQVLPSLRREFRALKAFRFETLERRAAFLLATVAGTQGDDTEHVIEAEPDGHLAELPVPRSTVRAQLDAHDFLKLDEAEKRFEVERGDWHVEGPIVLPEGYGLKIFAGTTLRFPADGYMLVHGPLFFEGHADRPIVLQGRTEEAPWRGLAVMKAGWESTWSNVRVNHTTGISLPMWSLASGVTFYRSPVVMRDSLFSGNTAEDAVNIVHSNFEIEGVTIENVASDGLDCDFSKGAIHGGGFTNIAGDAIDISGSRVTVDGTVFRIVGDKAVSVGERSQMTVRNITVTEAGTGVASKDGSILTIEDSSIAGVTNAGMMAYTKKPRFGPARITALRIEFDDVAQHAIAQTGSQIMLDGADMADVDVDVDVEKLYDTIMSPGTRDQPDKLQ